ncbi:hypothetical protein CC1G_04828 [Coprinopsis cinerea okayama7|uniref:N-acetyltransferase domain-containing protein n=1 Tax=Coprinopsis cinerea (strain Okayama-7 / 130 / ATCC MYA-4618 / FGSC 9003) TaxID=240176 RepID=A8PFQ3_COPC7|nr:hypothetical protein CC1G_04828 [Coprinopsis cinerea okayama7\|eukprot:XP_001840984.1 hypothetical protein CC1G_04828 [Coprinopsis cinerea okayama7\
MSPSSHHKPSLKPHAGDGPIHIDVVNPNPNTHIRIRVFRESDTARVHELFKTGIGYGPKSSRHAALRGSLTGLFSISTYIFFLIGAALLVFPHESPLCPPRATRYLGLALCLLSATLFFYHRNLINRWFLKHANSVERSTDFRDIRTFYNIGEDGKLGADGFWVAELIADGEEEGQVVGCVGLAKFKSTNPFPPTTSELRRMAVDASLQRRGIGKKLLTTVLAHARNQEIMSIRLSTTAHQKSAVGIYERFGWKMLGVSRMITVDKVGPRWVDLRVVDFELDLVGGNGEKMA